MNNRIVDIRIELDRRAAASSGVRRATFQEAARVVDLMMTIEEKAVYRRDRA